MMKVLLVDDDTNFRRSLTIGLETSGLHVFEARGGMEALEFLQTNQESENRVQGVVVDARMPGVDGFWLADQISSMYPNIRIVILSAHVYPNDVEDYTVLTKPVQIPILVDTLAQDVSPTR